MRVSMPGMSRAGVQDRNRDTENTENTGLFHLALRVFRVRWVRTGGQH